LYTAIAAGQTPDADLVAHSRVPAHGAPLPASHAPPELAALLVDAYAVQHHGVPTSPQAVQSVAVHLLSLHGVIGLGQRVDRALWIRRRALRERGIFHWLTPPTEPALTIRHLIAGGGVTTPRTMADFVVSVYEVWRAVHGATIAQWYGRAVAAD
jgi:hypothetical protein